jgi:hypothetical protein
MPVSTCDLSLVERDDGTQATVTLGDPLDDLAVPTEQ